MCLPFLYPMVIIKSKYSKFVRFIIFNLSLFCHVLGTWVTTCFQCCHHVVWTDCYISRHSTIPTYGSFLHQNTSHASRVLCCHTPTTAAPSCLSYQQIHLHVWTCRRLYCSPAIISLICLFGTTASLTSGPSYVSTFLIFCVNVEVYNKLLCSYLGSFCWYMTEELNFMEQSILRS